MPQVQHFDHAEYNPLDRVEMLAEDRDWPVNRSNVNEINLVVAASWCDLQLNLNWRDDLESLLAACYLESKVPQARRAEVARLTSLINEGLIQGHFDLWRENGTLLYRNGLILAGGAEASEAQCDTLIRLAIDSCERYYPAFQFVTWAGKTAEEAIEASLFETMGEA